MRIWRIIGSATAVLLLVAGVVQASVEVGKDKIIEQIRSYFETYAASKENEAKITVLVTENGAIPESPFTVYRVRFLKGDKEIGNNNVLTDGKYIIPGDSKVVDLQSGKEIAERYFQKISRVDIAPEQSALVGGNAEAQVKVVIFSDYLCSHCGRFAQEDLPELLNRSDIAVYHYELPLSQIHPEAEDIARLAIAYRKLTGKEVPPNFYGKTKRQVRDYIERLLGGQSSLVFEEAESAATREALARSIELAGKLGIDRTPSVLVDGYRSKPLRGEIDVLIRDIQSDTPLSLK